MAIGINHDGGKHERYSSESGLGRGRKIKYAREVNDDESKLENDEDDLEEEEDDEASDESKESGEEASNESEDESEDDGETDEDKMCRYSYGVIVMNYVQFLNLLGDENFAAKIK